MISTTGLVIAIATASASLLGLLVTGIIVVTVAIAWGVTKWREALRDERCEESRANVAKAGAEKETRLAAIVVSAQIKLAEIAATTRVRLAEIAQDKDLSAIDKLQALRADGDVNLHSGDLEVVVKANLSPNPTEGSSETSGKSPAPPPLNPKTAKKPQSSTRSAGQAVSS